MKLSKITRTAVVALALGGMLLPQFSMAAQPVSGNASTSDITLHANGVLHGFVVDQQGRPQAGQAVQILSNQQLLATVQTDKSGHFAVSGAKTGVYEFRTENTSQLVRAWNEQTAPPKSNVAAMIVSDDNVVRGQNCCCERKAVLGIKAGMAAVIAAAIAIPLAADAS